MSWQSIKVIGVPSRKSIDAGIASPKATTQLELEEDALPSHSFEICEMWFVSLRLTGTEASYTPRACPDNLYGFEVDL